MLSSSSRVHSPDFKQCCSHYAMLLQTTSDNVSYPACTNQSHRLERRFVEQLRKSTRYCRECSARRLEAASKSKTELKILTLSSPRLKCRQNPDQGPSVQQSVLIQNYFVTCRSRSRIGHVTLPSSPGSTAKTADKVGRAPAREPWPSRNTSFHIRIPRAIDLLVACQSLLTRLCVCRSSQAHLPLCAVAIYSPLTDWPTLGQVYNGHARR